MVIGWSSGGAPADTPPRGWEQTEECRSGCTRELADGDALFTVYICIVCNCFAVRVGCGYGCDEDGGGGGVVVGGAEKVLHSGTEDGLDGSTV